MNVMRKSAIVVFLIAFYCGPAWAISKDLKARSESMLAQDKFDARDYDSALEHANNARALRGKTNTRIQYLLVKTHWQLQQYLQAQHELEKYFEVTDRKNADPERFNEMVDLIAQIEEKTAEIRARQEKARKKQAEEKARKEAEEKARLKAVQEAEARKKELQIRNRANLVEFWRKLEGDKRVSLSEAGTIGVPSPPINLAAGKVWTMELKIEFKEQNHDSLSVVRYEVSDETDENYSGQIKTTKSMENGEDMLAKNPEIGQPRTMVWYKDGLVHKIDGLNYKSFKAKGFEWPTGRIKTGDTWENYSEGVVEFAPGNTISTKTTTQLRVSGFEHFMGRDCLVLNYEGIVITQMNDDPPEESRSQTKLYYDYNAGVPVYLELSSNDIHMTRKLLSLDVPKPN